MIVEVGPGSGKYSFRPHIAPSLNAVYIDVNPPGTGVGEANWIVADAHKLPLRNSVAEEIYAVHVVEHLEDPMLFLREVHRVLVRGGLLLIVVPNFMSVNAYADPDHKHVFNFFRLKRMLREAGFTVRHRVGQNVGSLMPKPLRLLIRLLMILFANDLIFAGVKP